MTPEALGLTLSPAGPVLLAVGVVLTAVTAFLLRRSGWGGAWWLVLPFGAGVPAALVGAAWPGAEVAWGVLLFVLAVQGVAGVAGALLGARGGARA